MSHVAIVDIDIDHEWVGTYTDNRLTPMLTELSINVEMHFADGMTLSGRVPLEPEEADELKRILDQIAARVERTIDETTLEASAPLATWIRRSL